MRRPLLLVLALSAAGIVAWLAWPAASPAPETGASSVPTGASGVPSLPSPMAAGPSATASMASVGGAAPISPALPARPDAGGRLPNESLANLVQRASAGQDPALAVTALRSARLCIHAKRSLEAMDHAVAATPGNAQVLASRQMLDAQVRDCQSLTLGEVTQMKSLAHLALRARAVGIGEVMPNLFKPEELDADEHLAAREVLQREINGCHLELLDTLLDWKGLALAPADIERYRQARLLNVQPYETTIKIEGADGKVSTLADYNVQRMQALAPLTRSLTPQQIADAKREAQALVQRCATGPG